MQTFFLTSCLASPPGPSSLILSSGLVFFHLLPLTMLQPARRLAVTPVHVIFCSCEHKYGISMSLPTLPRTCSEQLQMKPSPDFQLGLPLVWSAKSLCTRIWARKSGIDLGPGAEVVTSCYPFCLPWPIWSVGVCSVQAGNLKGHPNLR